MNVTITQALAISGIALLIIMAVLCCIMGIIYLMSFSIKKTDGKSLKDVFKALQNKDSENNQSKAISQSSYNAIEVKPNLCGIRGSVNLYDVCDKDAAMIMAIVADTEGIELDKLIFKSIKELKGDN